MSMMLAAALGYARYFGLHVFSAYPAAAATEPIALRLMLVEGRDATALRRATSWARRDEHDADRQS
jgi:hypothetical protein